MEVENVMNGHVLHLGELQWDVPGGEVAALGREERTSKLRRLAFLLYANRGGEWKIEDKVSVDCRRCQWERMMVLTATVAGWYCRVRMGRSEVVGFPWDCRWCSRGFWRTL